MKLVLAAFAICSLLSGCAKEVTLENQRWAYDKGTCEVSFTLKNHGNYEVDRNVRIVAYKLKDIGEGAVVSDITGEKSIVVRLKPYEEKEVTETMKLFPSRRPDIVVVNQYEKR